MLQFSQHDPEDLDTTQEDHFADSARYFCMMRPIAARKNVKTGKPAFDPLNQFHETNNNVYGSFGAMRR